MREGNVERDSQKPTKSAVCFVKFLCLGLRLKHLGLKAPRSRATSRLVRRRRSWGNPHQLYGTDVTMHEGGATLCAAQVQPRQAWSSLPGGMPLIKKGRGFFCRCCLSAQPRESARAHVLTPDELLRNFFFSTGCLECQMRRLPRVFALERSAIMLNNVGRETTQERSTTCRLLRHLFCVIKSSSHLNGRIHLRPETQEQTS